MSSLDPTRLPPLPPLKSFALTHILYDPAHPLSIPLSLLSLSPIFLFVAYFTLLIFDRRLTVLSLGLGSIANEALSLILKRTLKGERPYAGFGEVGHGYGMPSSHSQAAGFLVAWGIGYWWTLPRRSSASRVRTNGQETAAASIGQLRRGVYVFGLVSWSVLTAYSRWHLHYHSPIQVIAGYLFGLLFGTIYFMLTEYIPLYHPQSILGKLRKGVESIWLGVGGVGGWELGGAPGGWGEGWMFVGEDQVAMSRLKQKGS